MTSTIKKGAMMEEKAPIWWSNAIFFVSMHVLALVGVLHLSPWHQLRKETFWMCMASWQLATFGITVGYHRLWSHRAFTASFPLRVVLAALGCLGFQGSIKWWVLRHRLHHRFTDTDSDPYNAKQGLYHSHMGWIFRKPNYPKMAIVDRKDLDADPVVRFQHRHYIPLTIGLGLVLPTLIGWAYGDPMGGFVWGGVVGRILIWFGTFSINSFAHYLGDQSYTEDVTARGNTLLAIVTGGEANHNYHHAFPRDYRNGPRALDWDPSKWIIYVLHNCTPFVPKVHQTPESDILKARAHVLAVQAQKLSKQDEEEEETSSSFTLWGQFAEMDGDEDAGSATSRGQTSASSSSSTAGSSSEEMDDMFEKDRRSMRSRSRKGGLNIHSTPTWTREQLVAKLGDSPKSPVVVVVNGWAIDVTAYAMDHPGGYAVLRQYAVGKGKEEVDATEAFEGGLNDHGWSAREKMKGMRIGKVA